MKAKLKLVKSDFTKVNHDTNGNPRFAVHFLRFLTNEEQQEFSAKFGISAISEMYDFARQRAKKAGGRKFHNRQYGGGIVFQMYGTQDEINQINNIINEDIK